MSVVSRREREKLQRRQAILDAAKELFLEKGYFLTTMEAIAEKAEAGVSPWKLAWRPAQRWTGLPTP